jgi:enterochelin esterase-like enzyme/outer membrane protein assembly factor BamB
VIADGTVYAVGPRGQLVALALADGAERWSLDLVEDLGATVPDYGFTTTPLVEGELLIVQVGGSEGRLMCGLDRATGELRWSAGEGEAGYASPVAMDLAGARQVVVMNGQELLGLAPETGAVLWQHALGERESAGSGVPGPIDGERFYANVGSGIAVLRVTAGEVGYTIESEALASDLGRTYAAPVHHDGHLYGFKSDFLSCVDASSGDRAWRSRPPGGKGLIVVGDRLVVFAAEGALVIARATPEGYEEEARLDALDHTSFTWPAFADGRVYLRNNTELACVEVVAGAEPLAASGRPEAPRPPRPPRTGANTAGASGSSGEIGAAVAAVEQAAAAVERLLAGREALPVVEDGQVHFFWRGRAEDVAVLGSMVDGGAEPLRRIGAELFHGAYPIEPGARYEYLFQVDFGNVVPDPLNPRTVPGDRGPVSEVVTPGYPQAVHFEEPAEGVARGRLDTYEFGEAPGSSREVSVYLPAGYDGSQERYPLLVVQQGPDYLEKAAFTNTLDNLIGERVRPVVVAFVTQTPRWWHEAGGTGTEEYLDMLAGEFVDDLGRRYRLLDGPEHRVVMGAQAFGLAATYAGLRHPEVFGGVALQSPVLKDIARHAVDALIEEEPLESVAFHVDWNRYEPRNEDDFLEADHAAGARALYERLRERGYEVTGGEQLDSAGWGAWRARTDDVLERFFPLEQD